MADSLTSGAEFDKLTKELQQANKSLENLEKIDASSATTQDLLKLDEARTKVRDKEKAKRESEEKANEIRNIQLLEGLHGMARVSEKFRQKAEKFKKVAAGKIKDWGQEKLAAVKNTAKGLLDFLMKGLGIAALWAIFKLIASTDWEKLLSDVGFWIDAIFTGITRIGAWLGTDKLITFLTGKSPLTSFMTKIKSLFAKETFLGKMLTKIDDFFHGKGGKLSQRLDKFNKSVKNLFSKEGFIGKIITSIKNFFSGKGGRMSKLLTKIGGWFTSIGGIASKVSGLSKVMGFVKGAAKFLGKIFLPVTVLMALWEAVSGFMTGFSETEGNFAQKILGGIGGAIKGLLDFFIFSIAEMIQDVIVWVGEFFGFDMSAVSDFDLVGKVKEAVFGVIDFVTELFSFRDTSLAGIFKSLVDIIMLPLNMAINFIKGLFGWGDPEEPFKFSEFVIDTWNTVVAWVKGLFSWGMAAGETEDGGWSLMKFVNEVWAKVKGWVTGLLSWASSEDEEDSFIVSTIKKTIKGVKEWFSKMFKFDSASDILASAFNVLTFLPNIIKDALLSITSWLLDLFGFGEEAKTVANAKNFSIGDMVVNLLDKLVTWLSELFDFDIKKIMMESLGALGDAGKKVMGWLGFGGDDVEKSATGGPIGAGVPTIVGEHGPELFVPSGSGRILPKAQTETALSRGGGAPIIMSAPTTNVRGGSSTTMAIASSSINPMHNKYFRN